MIEVTLLNFLNAKLSLPVFTQVPKTLPEKFYVIEKTGGGMTEHITTSMFAIQSYAKSMYEAAAIEGCTSWESLWKITFPMISPLLLVNFIYTVVDFCMRTDNTVMEKIQTVMNELLNYGSASAMSWIYFGIVGAAIALISFILSKVVYYYD